MYWVTTGLKLIFKMFVVLKNAQIRSLIIICSNTLFYVTSRVELNLTFIIYLSCFQECIASKSTGNNMSSHKMRILSLSQLTAVLQMTFIG